VARQSTLPRIELYGTACGRQSPLGGGTADGANGRHCWLRAFRRRPLKEARSWLPPHLRWLRQLGPGAHSQGLGACATAGQGQKQLEEVAAQSSELLSACGSGRYRPPVATRWRNTMAHSWRNNAGGLLAIYLLLGLAAVAAAGAARPALSCLASAKCWVPYDDQPSWLPVMAFLAWRVSRGGRVSWIGLIGWSALGYTAVATTIASVWSLPALSLLAIYAIQIALLTSPAVYQRTRGDDHAALSHPSARIAWPPLWLISTGLLAGLVVTLLYLANMNWTPIPGCGGPGASPDQLPARCIGLAQGYPLRFLTADQNIPVINKEALVKDWAQWSLVSFSAFYLLWLRRDPAPEPTQVSAGEQPVPQ